MIKGVYCANCGQERVRFNGKNRDGSQRHVCGNCGSHKPPKKGNKKLTPNILVFDIENAPLEAYVWNTQVWNARISPSQLIQDWNMISWSAKWLNDSKIMNACLTPKESKDRDDERVVKKLWKLFDKASIVVAHNGRKFDVPMANTRFIKYGMKPPSPFKIVDTLRMARGSFNITYNKLDYLGEFLGLGRKLPTEFDLWVRCLNGERKALKEMQTYNDQDVILLEEVYHKLKSWGKSHPNYNVYHNTKDCCSTCGSKNLKRKGEYVTMVNSFDTFQCRDCGSFSRVSKNKLVSVAT